MTWRKALLCGVLAAGLTVTLVPRASADPPPWAGRWHHNKHWNGDHDHGRRHWDHDHDYWERRHEDWDRRWRYGRDDDYWRWRRRYHRDHDYPYYGGYRYGGRYDGRYDNSRYDANYGKLMDRMRNDQAKIAEIEPTGRHRKALQWYKDDLNNAQRDLDNYRDARR